MINEIQTGRFKTISEYKILEIVCEELSYQYLAANERLKKCPHNEMYLKRLRRIKSMFNEISEALIEIAKKEFNS